MRIPKTIRKDWRIHLAYIVIFTMLIAGVTIHSQFNRIEELKLELADTQQVLNQCNHSFEIWESQLESGKIILKFKDLPLYEGTK